MIREMLEQVREKAPLVHNITNYVTVNDCANILLACGASPIMADAMGEAADITAICGGLNINIGTLNQNTIPSMFAAGKMANQCGHPVLLDPVGAGASSLRTETACRLVDEIHLTAIKGNVSEIKALTLGGGTTKGVDADIIDMVTEKNLDSIVTFAKKLSAKNHAIIAITGAIDIVTDREQAYIIRNGHPMMSRVTGTGCMLGAMMTAYLIANEKHPLEAAAAAVCAMGLCGELAFQRLSEREGNASYRSYIIDEIFHLSGEVLERGARYEVR